MSPLWISKKNHTYKTKQSMSRNIQTKKIITIHESPSPKQISDNQSFAQKQSKSNLLSDAIEGISLSASLSKKIAAGMTVEASVVFPLFLFFFLNLGCVIEFLRLHGNVEFAMCDIGNRMAVYGHALSEFGSEEETSELWNEIRDIGFSYAFVKNAIVDYLGAEYIEESPLVGGVEGLRFAESEIFTENDCFEVIVTYTVSPLSNISSFGTLSMVNKYYGHLWNGYQIPEDKQEVLYVAENGVVYHENRNCSHLFLSVREVSLQEAYTARNNEGRKYELCMRCGDHKMKSIVYIADEGEHIHCERYCPGLRRTVYVYQKEEVNGYQPCSRCVGK